MIVRFFSLFSLLFLLNFPVLAQMAPEDPTHFKLVFWNIQWFPGGKMDGATEAEVKAQIAAVQSQIEELDPDILGMQEIRDEKAAELAIAKLPGASVQVCSDFLSSRGEKTTQQLVIASRLPAIGAWWEAWKEGPRITPKRGFAFAAFQPTPGNVLLVYTVHLKSNRGELAENIAMREESAFQLLSHVAAMEKAYRGLGTVSVIIGGDFNTSADDAKFGLEKTLSKMEAAGFESSWKNKPLKQRVTLPSAPSKNPKSPPFPDACFDFVFVKNARILTTSVNIPATNPSDHRAVVVEVALPVVQN